MPHKSCAPSAPERYFFHSFPRSPANEDERTQKGLKILECMCSHGLLLVPEFRDWRDPTGSRTGDTTSARQRRACFTELSLDKLPAHAVRFGPFAIQFEIDQLRSLGALPVIYVPQPRSDTPALDWAGISLLARLSDATDVMRNLVRLQNLQTRTLIATVRDRDGAALSTRYFDEHETAAIRDFVASLENAPGHPLTQVLGALESIASMFYPTEDLKYTDLLDYYRQREWRIFSGPILNGKPTTTLATEEQIAQLLEIDSAFYSKMLPYPEGEASRASKSHFMLTVGEKHVLSTAKAIIVPRAAHDEARRIVNEHRLAIPITTLDKASA